MADGTSQNLAAYIEAFDSLGGAAIEGMLATGVAYGRNPIAERYPDAGALRNGICTGEPVAIGSLFCILAKHDDGSASQDVGLAILHDAALTADDQLVLTTIRELVYYDDEDTFRAIMPFAVNRPAGGWLTIDDCPVASRAQIACDYLESHLSMVADAPLRWPTLDAPSDAEIPADDPDGFEADHDVLRRLYPDADERTRQRMRTIARDWFERASNVRGRRRAMYALAEMGDVDAAWTLAELADEQLRNLGFHLLMKHDPWACLSRYGTHLARAERDAAGDARHQSLRRSMTTNRGELAICELGDGNVWLIHRDCERWRVGDLDPTTGTWSRRGFFDHAAETGDVQQITASVAKSARGRYRGLVYVDRFAEEHRLYVHVVPPDGETEVEVAVAHSRAELDTQLGTKPRRRPAANKPTTTAKPRAVAKPRRPLNKARYEQREVERAEGASEGRVAVPGHKHVGLYDTDQERVICAPPGAVEIAAAGDEAVAWVVEKLPGHSGVARGDYEWRIEIWPLDGECAATAHVIGARQVIEWYWPGSVSCAKRNKYRIIVLTCISEDDRLRLYVVRRPDGTFVETRERAEADRLAKW